MSIIGLGTGIVGGVVAEITVIGLGRNGHVVHVDADTGVSQTGKHLIPVLHPDHIEVVATESVMPLVQGLDRQSGQQLVVAGSQQPAPVNELRQAGELAASQRRLDVGQAIVEAEYLLLVVPAPGVSTVNCAGSRVMPWLR